jgi:hypothetical protein
MAWYPSEDMRRKFAALDNLWFDGKDSAHGGKAAAIGDKYKHLLRGWFDAADRAERNKFKNKGELIDDGLPPPEVWEFLKDHFRKRPFDMIRWGLLKIVDQKQQLVWFEPNGEQMMMLEDAELRWYNKLPVFYILLKARRIGASTLFDAINLMLIIWKDYQMGHIVADLNEKAGYHVKIVERFHQNLPIFLRPTQTRKSHPRIFDDEAFGLRDSQLFIESAERGEKISRTYEFFFNHFTEVPYWNQTVISGVLVALVSAIQLEWPYWCIMESTGKQMGDMFSKDYFLAKAGQKKPYKSWFFPWFSHAGYRTRLPQGVSDEQFISQLMDIDKDMMDLYRLDCEQVNWYIQKRESMLTGADAFTVELFKRDYPCNEREAFIGGGSNFFDTDKLKHEHVRCADIWATKYGLDSLQESTTKIEGQRCGRVLADLVHDAENGYTGPRLKYNPLGKWQIWEPPRPGHKYVVTLDPAEGKQSVKGLPSSSDFLTIGVWRYTYAPDEAKKIAQCAQFRSQTMGPREGAQLAVGASALYLSNGAKSMLIIERNSFGLSSIEEAKDAQATLYMRIVRGQYREEVTRELGFLTTGGQGVGTKINILTQFRKAWGEDLICLNSLATVTEMQCFAQDDRGRLHAIPPAHDDTIMDAAMATEAIASLLGCVAVEPMAVGVAALYEEYEESDWKRPRKLKKPGDTKQAELEEVMAGYGI